MSWRRLAAVIVALGMVAGVTPTAQAKHRIIKSPVIVQFDAWATPKSPQAAAINIVISKFEKDYKYIKVVFTPLSGNVEQELEQAIISGNTVTPPDVFEVDAGWMSDFASPGYLQREDVYAKTQKSFDPADFYESLRGAFRYKGVQYVYPTGFTTLGLYYNKPLLGAAGYKSAPRSAKAFAAAACKLTNDTTHVYGASLSPDAYHWFPFVPGFGGRVLNKSQTAAAIESKHTVNALQWYAGLIARSCAEVPPAGSSDIEEFAGSHAAMTIEPSTSVPELKQLAPHLSWGVVPLPKGPKGESDITDAVGFAMNAASPVKTASWKLIHFLDGAHSMATIDSATGYLPARASVKPSKAVSAFVRADSNAFTWAWPPGLVVNAFPHIDNDIQSASAGQMTYSNAVIDMQSWLKAYLP